MAGQCLLGRGNQTMVIITNYAVERNPETGVFCDQQGRLPLPVVWLPAEEKG